MNGRGKPFPCSQGEETDIAGQGTKAEASEKHNHPRQSIHEEAQP